MFHGTPVGLDDVHDVQNALARGLRIADDGNAFDGVNGVWKAWLAGFFVIRCGVFVGVRRLGLDGMGKDRGVVHDVIGGGGGDEQRPAVQDIDDWDVLVLLVLIEILSILRHEHPGVSGPRVAQRLSLSPCGP